MQGKSKLPKIEMEFRNTARSILKKMDFEQEQKALLSVVDEKDERSKEVLEVSQIRMSLAEEIKIVLDKLVATKSKDEQARLKEAQKNLMDEFMSLPELGSTFDEWMEAVDQGLVKRSAGRPPIPFEVNLIRARELAQSAMANYIKLSNELGNPKTLDDPSLRHPLSEKDMLDLYARVTANMGKDSNDELGVIDAEIRKLDSKIHYITSGEAQRDRDEKLRHAKYSSNGTRLGRPFEPLDETLARLEGEKEALEEKRERLESNLSTIEKMARRIKIEEDKLRDVRRLIRSKGWDPRKDSREGMPYGDILSETEAMIAKLKDMKKTAESGSKKADQRKAEREIERRIVMRNELNREHEREESIRKSIAEKGDLEEGVDQLVKDIVGRI